MVVCTNSPPVTCISTQAPPASVAAPPAVSLFWQVLHTSHHPEIPDPIQIQFIKGKTSLLKTDHFEWDGPSL